MQKQYLYLFLFILIFSTTSLHAQNKMGDQAATVPVHAGAWLELSNGTLPLANNRGFLIAKVNLIPPTTAWGIAGTAVDGMLVYNSNASFGDGKGLYVWEGTQWTAVGATVASAKVDGDAWGVNGEDITSSIIRTGSTAVGVAGGGRVGLNSGTATQTGYVEVRKADNTRLGYIGWDNTDLTYIAENGAQHVFLGANVGIGTATPTAALQVASANAEGINIDRYNTGNTSGTRLSLRKSKNATVGSHTALADGDYIGMVDFYASNGTGFPVAGSPNANIKAETAGVQSATNAGGELVFGTTSSGTTAVAERMRIDHNGNVGIGTTAPTSILDVVLPSTSDANVTARFYNSSNVAGAFTKIGIGAGTPTSASLLYTNVDNISNSRLSIANYINDAEYLTVDMAGANQGNVGIGTTAPTHKLHIVDNSTAFNTAKIQGGTQFGGSQLILQNNSTSTWAIGVFGSSALITDPLFPNNFFYIDNNAISQRALVINNSNNNVGIGTTAPTHKLHVIGTAGLSTGTAWTNTSDMRLKENVKAYNRGLKEIMQINPIYYEYTENSGLKNAPEFGANIGISAQELQKIIPEAISTKAVTLKDGTIMQDALELTKADAMWFALINATKELNAKVEAKDAENKELKIENQAIKAEIEALKAAVKALTEKK